MAGDAADRRWMGRAAPGAVVLVGYAVIVAPLVFVSWLAITRRRLPGRETINTLLLPLVVPGVVTAAAI